MKAQNVANVIPISIVPTPNLLHNNNVGATYVRTSNKICTILLCGNA
jgi:hypothetical protein